MLQQGAGWLGSLLGIHREIADVSAGQMALRTLAISLFALLAQRTDWFGALVKGARIKLIESGKVLRDGLRRAEMTPTDLAQVLRLQARQRDPSRIQAAYMERNGEISVLPSDEEKEPQVIDVSVKQGVQTVRIEVP